MSPANPSETPPKPKPQRSRWLWMLLALAVFFSFNPQLLPGLGGDKFSYTELKAAISAGQIEEARVGATRITARFKPGLRKKPEVELVRVDDKDLLADLTRANVRVSGVVESGWLGALIGWLVPLALMALLWLPMLRKGGPMGGLFAAGQSRAKIYEEHSVGVSFADVAGVDEAKEELSEVIQFLKTPEKFGRLGGKIPKGVLLVGPPGTGKTLLARAVAGEANVPFFSISGSEFVELFVGVGAARVRDLFQKARDRAPCIIFIDELDALGKARTAGPMAHEEREQTLNQLLVELDGFDPRSGVILLAATNRPEILDPALLRAGRFDRQIVVDRPDRAGRLAILKVHARTIAFAPEADLEPIASLTAGLVGADLANIVNEAALLAVRRGLDKVGPAELQEAVERVIGGLEKRKRVLSPKERERVAHHEGGHALVALAVGHDPIRKISIIPRGVAALGYTLQLPTEDRYLMTQRELEDRIAVLLGGRVAEEVAVGDISTGAQDDLAKATEIARAMVRSYGMSARLGPLTFERERSGCELTSGAREHGDEVDRLIDSEVRRIIDEQHDRAAQILEGAKGALKRIAAELLVRETLSGEELGALLKTCDGERLAS